MNQKTVCVVSVGGVENFNNFYSAWEKELSEVVLLIVEDNDEVSIELNHEGQVFCRADIDAELGTNAWIITQNTQALMSYGCLKAYEANAEFIIILDEMSRPEEEGLIESHIQALTSNCEETAWSSTLNNAKPKGMPYYHTKRQSSLVLNHGMWTEKAVLDAVSELSITESSSEISFNEGVIGKGQYFSMSALNVAFRRQATPLMYFLLTGEDEPFQGCGDTWCGIIAKKVMDHLNWGCRSGTPYIKNCREENIWHRLRSESATVPVNENFWEKIDAIILCSNSVEGCYVQIAETIESWGHPYFKKLSNAMKCWVSYFQEGAKKVRKSKPKVRDVQRTHEEIIPQVVSEEGKSQSEISEVMNYFSKKDAIEESAATINPLLDFLHAKAEKKPLVEEAKPELYKPDKKKTPQALPQEANGAFIPR